MHHCKITHEKLPKNLHVHIALLLINLSSHFYLSVHKWISFWCANKFEIANNHLFLFHIARFNYFASIASWANTSQTTKYILWQNHFHWISICIEAISRSKILKYWVAPYFSIWNLNIWIGTHTVTDWLSMSTYVMLLLTQYSLCVYCSHLHPGSAYTSFANTIIFSLIAFGWQGKQYTKIYWNW